MTTEDFLKTYDVSQYDRPSLTTDVVIFTVDQKELKVLLSKRLAEPFEGAWALPGGFLKLDRTLEENAKTILKEKTGVKDVYIEQLFTFGDLDRDPRTRVITVAYFALLPFKQLQAELNDHSQFVSIDNLPELAFDHKAIIEYARTRLANKIKYTTISFNLLNDKSAFTIGELQKIHEAILGKKLIRMNFRRDFIKQFVDTGKVEATGETSTAFSNKPSTVYRLLKMEDTV